MQCSIIQSTLARDTLMVFNRSLILISISAARDPKTVRICLHELGMSSIPSRRATDLYLLSASRQHFKNSQNLSSQPGCVRTCREACLTNWSKPLWASRAHPIGYLRFGGIRYPKVSQEPCPLNPRGTEVGDFWSSICDSGKANPGYWTLAFGFCFLSLSLPLFLSFFLPFFGSYMRSGRIHWMLANES